MDVFEYHISIGKSYLSPIMDMYNDISMIPNDKYKTLE